MHVHDRSRWLLGLGLVACLGAALAAQAPRPLPSRSTPLDVLCGPQASLSLPAQTVRVLGGIERTKQLFAPGETVIIGAGAAQGLEAGQHFFVRRAIEDRFAVKTSDSPILSIQTAGWLTVVDAQAEVATGRIVEACDGILEGDYLEPFVLPAPAGALDAGKPDFASPAQVILGSERRQLAAAGGLMVIDRGTDHGIRPGQRLTVFRTTLDGAGPVTSIADAVVVSTQPETSLIRIEKSSDAVQVGDKVAIHR